MIPKMRHLGYGSAGVVATSKTAVLPREEGGKESNSNGRAVASSDANGVPLKN